MMLRLVLGWQWCSIKYVDSTSPAFLTPNIQRVDFFEFFSIENILGKCGKSNSKLGVNTNYGTKNLPGIVKIIANLPTSETTLSFGKNVFSCFDADIDCKTVGWFPGVKTI